MKKLFIFAAIILFPTIFLTTTKINAITFYDFILSGQNLKTNDEVLEEFICTEKELKSTKDNRSICKFSSANLIDSLEKLFNQDVNQEIKIKSGIKLARIILDKKTNKNNSIKAKKILNTVIVVCRANENFHELSNAYSEKIKLYKRRLKSLKAQKNITLWLEAKYLKKIYKNSQKSVDALQKIKNIEEKEAYKTTKTQKTNNLEREEYIIEDMVNVATYAEKYINHESIKESCSNAKLEKYKKIIHESLNSAIKLIDNSEERNSNGCLIFNKAKAAARLANFYRQYNLKDKNSIVALIENAKKLFEINKKLISDCYYDYAIKKKEEYIEKSLKEAFIGKTDE